MRFECLACVVLGAALAACGSSEDPSTSSTTSSSTASGAGGSSTTTGDATSSTSASGSGAGGGAPACTPTPGSKAIDAYCDSVRLAVLEHTGGKARAAIRGRLSTTPGACL